MTDVATRHEASEQLAVAPPPPLYWRLLRLHYLQPNGWQRAILVEGVLALAVVLVLADAATAWSLLVLPLASGAIVKLNDFVAGLLPNAERHPLPAQRAGDYLPFVALAALLPILALTVHGTGDSVLRLLVVAEYVGISIAIYRYLRRRGCPQGRAIGIAVVSLVLSPLAGIFAAGLEGRRLRQEAAGMRTAPPPPG